MINNSPPAAVISLCKFEEDFDRRLSSESRLRSPTCVLQTITPDKPNMYYSELHGV